MGFEGCYAQHLYQVYLEEDDDDEEDEDDDEKEQDEEDDEKEQDEEDDEVLLIQWKWTICRSVTGLTS